MSGFHIRRAAALDAGALGELIERFYRIDGHPFDVARIEAGLLPLLRDDRHGQVWIACDPQGRADDDVIVGYVVVTWSWSLESGGRDCILDELYVDRRGEGIGGALLSRAMEEARSAGASAMFLETEAPNEAARRFYRRYGFDTEGSTWMSRPLR